MQKIANEYGFRNLEDMSNFAKTKYGKAVKVKLFPGETSIDDTLVDEFVKAYAEIAKQRDFILEEEAQFSAVARTMPITSGTNFEGHRITRYGGYVSGDEVATIPMGLFTGIISDDDVNETIKKVRRVAIQELKEAAANLGCNAVIGLDFDYITIEGKGPQNMNEIKIVLTANGTAVEIEPL